MTLPARPLACSVAPARPATVHATDSRVKPEADSPSAGAARRRRAGRVVGLAVLAALVLPVSPAMAHSTQEFTEPEHGAELETSPERIAVGFDHAMRFAWFRVEGPQGEIALDSEPPKRTVTGFSAQPLEPLQPGEYVVSWRGMAADGHVMIDEFDFVVR